MTINTNSILHAPLNKDFSLKTEAKAFSSEFESELQRQLIENLHAQKKEKDIQTDIGLEDFKRKLSSMGALGFLQSFNLEKIETLIAEKKDVLMKELGLSKDTVPPLDAEARKGAIKTLEALLDSYKKELLEKIKSEDKLEKSNQVLSSILQKF